MSDLDKLRNCLATATPPGLATLTVRVLGYAEDAPNTMRPRAGARVYVEGIPVGRTGRDGTLTARVPSGPVGVQAEMPITEANWVDVTLAPGQSKSIEIGLSDGKEVDEHTTLVLAEAVDDIVPAQARSLTLKFIRDGRLTPVTSIDNVDLVTPEGNHLAATADHFSVVGGALVGEGRRSRVRGSRAAVRRPHRPAGADHGHCPGDAPGKHRVPRRTVAVVGDPRAAAVESRACRLED